MATNSVDVAVPNGVIFIIDKSGGFPPDPVRGATVLSTPSCIGVTCVIDCEGEATIVLMEGEPLASDISADDLAIFDGLLETPTKIVAVTNLVGDILLQSGVPRERTRVRIWINRLAEPDRIAILLS